MFYKKRIEVVEDKLDRLIKELELNEAIGAASSLCYSFDYISTSNKELGWQIRDNKSILGDLFVYLDVEYVAQPKTRWLVKKKKKE